MTHNLEQFRKDLKELGFALDGGQEEQFLTYYELLVKWNEVMNLTAITEYGQVLKKHFVDSLSLIKAVSDIADRDYTLIDVGTGNSFENRFS